LYVTNETPKNATDVLNGSVLVLIRFDVCEELCLDRLQMVKQASVRQQPRLKHAAPSCVRYERSPVVQPLQAFELESGESGGAGP